jgi:hypothetical protein
MMVEPESIVTVYWTDAPPREAFQRISDTHYVDPLRLEHFVLWRGRWCVVSDELQRVCDGDALGMVDKQALDGSLGVLLEKR